MIVFEQDRHNVWREVCTGAADLAALVTWAVATYPLGGVLCLCGGGLCQTSGTGLALSFGAHGTFCELPAELATVAQCAVYIRTVARRKVLDVQIVKVSELPCRPGRVYTGQLREINEETNPQKYSRYADLVCEKPFKVSDVFDYAISNPKETWGSVTLHINQNKKLEVAYRYGVWYADLSGSFFDLPVYSCAVIGDTYHRSDYVIKVKQLQKENTKRGSRIKTLNL